MIRFGAWSIVLLIGAVQGLCISLGLLTRPANRAANRFLSALIFLLSLKVVPYIIGYAGFYMVYPWLDLAPFDLSLGFGPLLFLYVTQLTQGRLPRRWALHLAPVAVQFCVYGVLFLQPLSFKHRFEDGPGPVFNLADNLLDCLSFVAYIGLTWRQSMAYERRLRERFANPDLHRLKPLRIALFVISLTLSAFVGAKLWSIVWPLSYYQMFPFYLLLTGVVYAFGFCAFQFAEMDCAIPEPAPVHETDWAAAAAQYAASLQNLSFWCDPMLSIGAAAKALGTTEARLSKAINVGLGMSFSTWINSYRVEKVAEQLALEGSEGNILEIAQRCGFNSKASFNRWFRAVKGCTPSEFRQSRSDSRAVPGPHRGQPQYPPSAGPS